MRRHSGRHHAVDESKLAKEILNKPKYAWQYTNLPHSIEKAPSSTLGYLAKRPINQRPQTGEKTVVIPKHLPLKHRIDHL